MGDLSSDSSWTLTFCTGSPPLNVRSTALESDTCKAGQDSSLPRPFALQAECLRSWELWFLGARGSCLYELMRTDCYGAGFGLLEQLPHEPRLLLPNYLQTSLPFSPFPDSLGSDLSFPLIAFSIIRVDLWCDFNSPKKHLLLQSSLLTFWYLRVKIPLLKFLPHEALSCEKAESLKEDLVHPSGPSCHHL